MANPIRTFFQKFTGSRLFRAIIYGGNYTDYSKWDKIRMVTQGYERNPVFAAIVDRVADLVSNVPLYVEYRGANHKLQTTTYHPLLEAMNRSDGGRKQLIEFVAKYLIVTGEGYLQKLCYEKADGYKELVNFVVMPSQHTNPIQGTPAEPVRGYEYLQNGRITFEKDEVVYMRRPSLSEYFHGASPTTALAEVLDLQNSAITWNKNVAQRGGLPALLVKMPGITPEAARQWKQDFGTINGGANNAGLPMIDGGRDTEYQNLNFRPNDAEWAKAIEITNRLIAMRFGFPSELLNDPSGKTYANVTEATKTLYRDIVLPTAELIYGSITRECSSYFSDAPVIRIDVDKIIALQDDKTKQIDSLVRATGGHAVLSVNEAREVLEFPATTNEAHNEVSESVDKAPVVSRPDSVTAQDEITATASVQSALNGAQVEAAVNVLLQVSAGGLAPETALLMLTNFFGIDAQTAQAMIENQSKITVTEEQTNVTI